MLPRGAASSAMARYTTHLRRGGKNSEACVLTTTGANQRPPAPGEWTEAGPSLFWLCPHFPNKGRKKGPDRHRSALLLLHTQKRRLPSAPCPFLVWLTFGVVDLFLAFACWFQRGISERPGPGHQLFDASPERQTADAKLDLFVFFFSKRENFILAQSTRALTSRTSATRTTK